MKLVHRQPDVPGFVRVQIGGEDETEVERIPLGARIRDVEVEPDGMIYVTTDKDDGKCLADQPAQVDELRRLS